MSLSWVNDRVGGPCQPGAWSRALPTLQFTPSGQGGRGEERKDEVGDRRNEAVTHVSAKTKGGPGKCYQTDLTTEMGPLSMTSIFVRGEFLKNCAVSPSNTWYLTSSVNLNDSHSFLIQAMLPSCQTDTSLQPTPGCQISQFVWRSPDCKILFWDLTDERYLISSNLLSSGAQICTTPNTPALALIWKWRSTYFVLAAKNGA